MLIFILGLCDSLELNFIPSTKTPPSSRYNSFLDYLKPRSSLILFGGSQDTLLCNDIWEFSLQSMTWQEIIPLSREVPGIFHLEPRKSFAGLASSSMAKFYIFGGYTSGGSENDLWEFDFDQQKWEIKKTLNSPSPRTDMGFVRIFEDNYEIFVIQGGMTLAGPVNEMWRLNLTSFEWALMDDSGEAPYPSLLPVILYYEDSLIQTAGYSNLNDCLPHLYQYSLTDRKWKIISEKNSTLKCRNLCQGFIHDHQLFILYGFFTLEEGKTKDTIKFDLKSEIKTWQTTNFFPELACGEYLLVKVQNFVYHLGGFSFSLNKYTNIFSKINLLTFKVIKIHNFLIFPKQRAHHSMVLINQKLYIFGGVHNDNVFNDLWTFDLDASLWSQVSAKGSIPAPRYHHASTVEGNSFVIWGGEDKTGLKNDFFIFNALTETWTELGSSSVKPRPAKGACLVLKNLSLYLYGGKTDSDVSNELWRYRLGNDKFELISDPDNYSVAFHQCWIDDEIFYSALGEVDNGNPTGTIKAFNLTSSTWSNFHDHGKNKWDSSQSLQLFVGNKLISIGGISWIYYLIEKITVLGPGNETNFYDLNTSLAIYGSASVYYKKNLVVFGGALQMGANLLHNTGHNLLFYFRVEEICEKLNCQDVCSAGTIPDGKTCKNCEAGSFSERPGNLKCTECKPGTFGQNISSSSSQQCLPCPEGYYNSEYGAKVCQVCPNDKYCPVGSTSYSEQEKIKTKKSIQPPLYKDPDLTESIIIYQTIVSVPIFLAMVLLFSIKKLRTWAINFDLFDDKHDNPDNEFIIKKKTIIGACFTFLVIIGGLLLTCNSTLEYFKANVLETKGLVTLAVLESDADIFEAEMFLVQILLYSYGGECGDKLKESISIITENINYTQKVFTNEKVENNSCKIRITFTRAVINSGALLIFTLNENPSYSSRIELNMTSSSSIPDHISSVLTNIQSAKSTVFIGPVSSEFYFLVTPSLFKSESTQWKDDETGYHITEQNNPKAGSMFKVEELFSVSYLNIKVFIEKSSTGLLTQRKLKQNFMFFVGSLLGTISGLFGIAGFVMTIFEKQIEKLWKIISSKNSNTMNTSGMDINSSKVIAVPTNLDGSFHR